MLTALVLSLILGVLLLAFGAYLLLRGQPPTRDISAADMDRILRAIEQPAPTPIARPVAVKPDTGPDTTCIKFVGHSGDAMGACTIQKAHRRPQMKHGGSVFLASHTDEDGTWVYRFVGSE